MPFATGLEMSRTGKSKRAAVYEKYQGRCAYCGNQIEHIDRMHVDHIHAKSLGGSGRIFNLNPACAPCNISKGDRDLDYLRISVALKKSPIAGIIGALAAVRLMEAGISLPLTVEKFFFETLEV